jgi:hypothetical protein
MLCKKVYTKFILCFDVREKWRVDVRRGAVGNFGPCWLRREL